MMLLAIIKPEVWQLSIALLTVLKMLNCKKKEREAEKVGDNDFDALNDKIN